jgi:hypothetical protein
MRIRIRTLAPTPPAITAATFNLILSTVSAVLRIRIRDPGLGAFLTPWIRDPGWEKVSIRIWDEQPASYFLELKNHFFAFLGVKILKIFDEDPGSGMETVRIRDPGWNKVGSGIRDKHPGSATLGICKSFVFVS